MPRHLARDTRASFARALGHAGRLTRRHVSGEHLMTILVSAFTRRDPRPARAVLHEYGATLEDVEEEIARRAGPGAVLFGGLDRTRWPLSGSISTPCGPGSSRLPGRKPWPRSSTGSLARPG